MATKEFGEAPDLTKEAMIAEPEKKESIKAKMPPSEGISAKDIQEPEQSQNKDILEEYPLLQENLKEENRKQLMEVFCHYLEEGQREYIKNPKGKESQRKERTYRIFQEERYLLLSWAVKRSVLSKKLREDCRKSPIANTAFT
jgi:hypothetical protein